MAATRRGRRLVLALLALLVPTTLSVRDSLPAAADATPPAATSAGTPAGDEILTARGDVDGYHLYIATTQGEWAWQALATLRPADMGDAWIGEQCLTGDGRYAVAVVLPRGGANIPEARMRGAAAYIVDVRRRTVQRIAGGVALAYYVPGCGAGDRVVLSRYLGDDGLATELVTVDAAADTVVDDRVVEGEITSAVPLDAGIAAVSGNSVVILGPAASAQRTAAVFDGRPYVLRANDAGGVDMLVSRAGGAGVARLDQDGLRTIGDGGAATQLLPGRGGANLVVGADRLDTTGTFLQAIAAPAGAEVSAASIDGSVLLSSTRTTPTQQQRAKLAGAPALPAATSLSLVASGTPVGSDKLPVDGASTDTTLAPLGTAGTPLPQPNPPSTNPPNTTTPTCAVPRNDPTAQVPQPNNTQVDWALQMAVRNLLTGSYARPAGYLNMGQASYAANTDFHEPALSVPAGVATSTVPPQVVEGILAQESNWDQASFHAAVGTAGNPLIANYYGTDSTFNSINYNNADCGYGIAQVTDYMTVASTAVSLGVKWRIAVDYAENIAAGITILSGKWNQLMSMGMAMNNGDPWQLENWYMALWAYNSGIHPDDGFGNFGLGWSNNPINPMYPPNRPEFLYDTYADASHPQDWPYQERVMGWMDTPLLTAQGQPSYQSATPAGDHLDIPPITLFCNASDQCNPSDTTGNYCTRPNDFHCWWHLPASFVSCPSSCHAGFFTVSSTATEPSVSDPFPPACTVSSSDVPDGEIVDEQPTNLNVVGCPNPPSGWSSAGTFTQVPGADNSGAPTGDIDWHQLGAGFGGHMFFTHSYPSTDTSQANTGIWNAGNLPSQGAQYTVKVFIPNMGGTDPSVPYVVDDGSGTTHTVTVNQDDYNNQWVTLGTWRIFSGATITVQSNHLAANDNSTYDIAFDAVAFVPEDLSYEGGAVIPSANIYVIFWQSSTPPPDPSAPPVTSDPAYPAAYQAYDQYIVQYAQEAWKTSEYKDVMPQYYQNNNGTLQYIQSTTRVFGVWTDTQPYPGPQCNPISGVCNLDNTSCGLDCLDDQSIDNEVHHAIAVNSGWTYTPGNVYIVVLGSGWSVCSAGVPGGVGSQCSNNTGPRQGLCGYHWFSGPPSDDDIPYAAIAYPDANSGCAASRTDAEGATIDGGLTIFAHELMEAIASPDTTGWCGDSGWTTAIQKCTSDTEIADKCEEQSTVHDSGATHTYLLQELWDNKTHQCRD